MITRLLPAAVSAQDSFGDVTGDDVLCPAERALIERAAPKRRREFTTVRWLARGALDRLGLPRAPVLPDRRGAPRWPDGVVGSMTHCDGYRAAAVARDRDILAIGIDAEPNQPLPDGLLGTVARPAERRWIARFAERHPGTAWDRLLFSAKESVFKAWYPRTRYELDFEHAQLTVDPAGTFTVVLLPPAGAPDTGWLTVGTGRWTARRDLVVTALVLPARPE